MQPDGSLKFNSLHEQAVRKTFNTGKPTEQTMAVLKQALHAGYRAVVGAADRPVEIAIRHLPVGIVVASHGSRLSQAS